MPKKKVPQREVKTIYLDDVKHTQCDCPKCTMVAGERVFIHSNCHPGSPTWVTMVTGGDSVLVLCATCEQPICRIAVASRPPPPPLKQEVSDEGFCA